MGISLNFIFSVFRLDDRGKFITVLAPENIDNLNIKRKMLDFEAFVLIGWLVQSVC